MVTSSLPGAREHLFIVAVNKVVYARATVSVGLYDAAFGVKIRVDGEYVAY